MRKLALWLLAGLALAQGPCPLELPHDLGRLCLKAPAKRVAVLDWRPLEDLLFLGVTPIAGADLKDFTAWVKMPLPRGIEDLGGRTSPNLERLAALQPELILGYTGFQGRLYPELSRIAPTALWDYLPEQDQLMAMRRHFLLHARLLGREEEGKRRLAELDRFLQEARDRLARAGLGGRPFLLVQAWAQEKVYNLFTPSTLASELLEAVGLRNAFRGPAEAYGLARVGPEGLLRLLREHPGVQVLFIAPKGRNPLEDPGLGPLIQGVQANLRPLDPATWTYGGPYSGRALVQEVLKAIGL